MLLKSSPYLTIMCQWRVNHIPSNDLFFQVGKGFSASVTLKKFLSVILKLTSLVLERMETMIETN